MKPLLSNNTDKLCSHSARWSTFFYATLYTRNLTVAWIREETRRLRHFSDCRQRWCTAGQKRGWRRVSSRARSSLVKPNWATSNSGPQANLRLNPDKTLEIIFYARGRCSTQIVPPLTFQNIQCVNSIKALRITTVSPVNFQWMRMSTPY